MLFFLEFLSFFWFSVVVYVYILVLWNVGEVRVIKILDYRDGIMGLYCLILNGWYVIKFMFRYCVDFLLGFIV